MILRWILRLFGLGFLLGSATGCGAGSRVSGDKDTMREGRERIARRLRRVADRIERMDLEEDDVKAD